MNVAASVAVLGDLQDNLDPEDFLRRACFIDARGGLIIGENVTFGFGVKILTRSHAIDDCIGEVVSRPIKIGNDVWIGSYALLYNCIIGDGAIVAAGAVVRSCKVLPNRIVAGNPAQVIARYGRNGWRYVGKKKWQVLR